jgi:polar amino acid transport system substrate-binding protein
MKTHRMFGATTVAILFAGTVTTTASAQQLPDRIQKAGKVVVANQPNYPPMEFKDPATNEFVGSTSTWGTRSPSSSGSTSSGPRSDSSR